MIFDNFGRKIDYLRISVTDRCNLRCRYCMPEEGVADIGHGQILRFDEIIRLAAIFADAGISHVKITGGEPLVRKDLDSLVKELYAVDGIEEVTLTTNGILLEEKLDDLYHAGVRNINISLDTMDRAHYEAITGFDGLEKVLSSVKACLAHEDIKLKINGLALAELTPDEITRLAGVAKENPVDVRFIEVMPMGMGKGMEGRSQDELLSILTANYGQPWLCEERRGNGPAVYYDFEGFSGKVGFISAMSHKFCDQCNRMRLTADGFLKPCLNYQTGVDLKELLRGAASDEEIAKAIREIVAIKGEGHCFDNLGEAYDQRIMSKIGG